MTTFNTKNIALIWRGITLTGFASKIAIIKQEEKNFETIFGLGGDFINYPIRKRKWQITSYFLANSPIFSLLEQDSLNLVENTLILKDLNTGSYDIFENCYISSLGEKNDTNERAVTWLAIRRNSK